MLDRVRGPPEEVSPYGAVQELQQGDDPRGALRRGAAGVAVEEEWEEAEAEGVALCVEAVFWGGGGGGRLVFFFVPGGFGKLKVEGKGGKGEAYRFSRS